MTGLPVGVRNKMHELRVSSLPFFKVLTVLFLGRLKENGKVYVLDEISKKRQDWLFQAVNILTVGVIVTCIYYQNILGYIAFCTMFFLFIMLGYF